MACPELHNDPAQVVELDTERRVSAALTVIRPPGKNPKVGVAFHDPARTEPGLDDEVYALTLSPDRAWQLGTALRRYADQAGGRPSGPHAASPAR